MEEIKENDVQKKEKQTEIRISLSTRIVGCFFSMCAILLLALTKILVNFGVINPVFIGVMSIVVYSLSLIGVLWNLFKSKNLSFDLIFSAGVAFLVFLVF